MPHIEPLRKRLLRRPFVQLLAAAAVVELLGILALAYGTGWIDPHHGTLSHETGHPAAVVAPSASPISIVVPAPSLSPSSLSPSSLSPSPTRSPEPSPSRSKATHAPAPSAGQRGFTFVNKTTQTIWLAGWQQTAKPALTTSGWVLAAGATLTVVVPDHWNGRFWGRTGCSFNASGNGHCQTGDCNGKFHCRGYGGIPATLAEYNLNSFDNLDFYDVSMVDGANLPMYINIVHGKTADRISSTGCIAAGCTKAVDCPTVLDVTVGSKVVGCISACARLNTDQYCCRGKWAPRSECDPSMWPIDYAAVFKKAEPYAYSYSDDDATSTFTCTEECDYRITFGVTP